MFFSTHKENYNTQTSLWDWGVVLLCTIVASVSTWVSYTGEYILAYNDATAHLNTARRIVDNLTPGLVQIGSVWLPLLHLLEIPFVLNDFLWQSGLAGAIVSGISFIIAGIFIFKLTKQCSQSNIAGLFAVLVYLTNVNMLYLQSTAMFEPLLIALATGAVYYLYRWTQSFIIKELIISAFLTMLATLTRYDGWALFLAISGYILVFSIFVYRKAKEGPVLIYIFLAGFGIFLWLLYNNMIFGDPLYFANSEYSAKAQQDVLFERGALPTKHNLPLSIVTYSYAVIVNNGFIIVSIALMGLVIYLYKNGRSFRNYSPLLLLIPYFFNCVSLYFGQSVIWLPMVPPFYTTYFNARYGILMLPALALLVGYFASRNIFTKGITALALVTQFILFFNPTLVPIAGQEVGIITLQDTVSSVNEQTRKASSFLNSNYRGGLILASSASEDAFIFRAGIPLKNFITEGTGHYWRESLEHPSRYATWIVFFNDTTDRVGKVVYSSPELTEYFEKVYQDQTYQIWKRK
ncbi:MAG: glycosyltransferase family 39 protein [bacterium]|nr:glycosyltransferase family 39 protein [bacterium]